MTSSVTRFREELTALSSSWRRKGLPSHATLNAIGAELLSKRRESGGTGLWRTAPLMVTATIDDGLGHGLGLIHKFADAVGLRVHPLGLLQPTQRIISTCQKELPDFLGLTVLQFDSEPDLITIRRGLPAGTLMLCGGPLFNVDPEFGKRCGLDHVAAHVGDFLEILLIHSMHSK